MAEDEDYNCKLLIAKKGRKGILYSLDTAKEARVTKYYYGD